MKQKLLLLTAIGIFLTGCTANGVSDETEKLFASYVCAQNGSDIINADEYKVKSGTLNNDIIPYGFNSFERLSGIKFYEVNGITNDNNVVLSFHNAENNNTAICLYNLNDNTFDKLAESPNGFVASVSAFNDNYIVYNCSDFDIDGQTNATTSEIRRINVNDKSDTVIFSKAEMTGVSVQRYVVVGDTLYFDVNGDLGGKIYSCDLVSGNTELYAENAREPMKYQNSVVYIRNNGDIVTKGDKAEKIVLPSQQLENVNSINCSDDVFTYQYYLFDDEQDPECATRSCVGFMKDEDRLDLFSSAEMGLYFSGISFNTAGYGIWNSGLIQNTLPSFYDINKNAFVIIDNVPKNYQCFVNDSSVLFITVDETTQTVNYYLAS